MNTTSVQALKSLEIEIQNEQRQIDMKTKELDRKMQEIEKKRQELQKLETEANHIKMHVEELKHRQTANEQSLSRLQVQLREAIDKKR